MNTQILHLHSLIVNILPHLLSLFFFLLHFFPAPVENKLNLIIFLTLKYFSIYLLIIRHSSAQPQCNCHAPQNLSLTQYYCLICSSYPNFPNCPNTCKTFFFLIQEAIKDRVFFLVFFNLEQLLSLYSLFLFHNIDIFEYLRAGSLHPTF